MNAIAISTPTTIDQVLILPHIYAKSHAQAYAQIGNENMLPTAGPIVSKKLFNKDGRLVYEFYRARNKEQKVYVIF